MNRGKDGDAIVYDNIPTFFFGGMKEMTRTKAMPAELQAEKKIPDTEIDERELPDNEIVEKEIPQIGNPENTIRIGNELIEIKPMKLKYQRNRTGVFYHVLDLYPLPDILAMGPKSFGDGRDGDKALLDWLVAATDREELVRANYNEMDTDTIYKILTIFKRVNKIEELEKKLKNAEAPREKA